MNQYNDILNKPAFDALEPERKKAFQGLMNKLQGKNMMEAMGIVLDFTKTMPQGKAISKQEQKAMIEAVMESMNDDDKKKFNAIIKMVGL